MSEGAQVQPGLETARAAGSAEEQAEPLGAAPGGWVQGRQPAGPGAWPEELAALAPGSRVSPEGSAAVEQPAGEEGPE